MQPVTRVADLRAIVREARTAGKRIGFVPTMGALHEGHLRLVDEARRRVDVVVMSIFVNPLQFGPSEDLLRYPRDLPGDSRLASARGVDVLFTPSVEEMYAERREVSVIPSTLDRRWEGEVRPGHFAGVLTVVAKLFNIVQPDVAIFGQKDYQQAALVRAMTRDLDFPVDVVVAPIVRESDGLAMSSRNRYLGEAERVQALSLSRAVRAIANAFKRGVREAPRLEHEGRQILSLTPELRLDYLALVDPERLEPVLVADPGTVAIVAGRLGSTRLIDNAILGAE